LGVVLLIAEAHGSDGIRCGIDELAQPVQRQGMVVAAGSDHLETILGVVLLLGIDATQYEALQLRRHISLKAVLALNLSGIILETDTEVRLVGRVIAIADISKNQYLAGSEDIRRQVGDAGPIDS